MSYQPETYRAVKDAFTEKRRRAEAEAEMRKQALHLQDKDLEAVDTALAQTGIRLFRIACSSAPDKEQQLTALRNENAELQEVRRLRLQQLGYPADYTDPHYECPRCKDNGYVGTAMCDCMKTVLMLTECRTLGIGPLIDRQRFDNFDLSYYAGDPAEQERMADNLRLMRAYAENFSLSSPNLLLIGGTGLGKTHLSTATARRVIERGYNVCYETAQNMLSDFEYDRFKSGYGESELRAEKYLTCELLILDDLGTEIANQFAIGCLYNVLNTRINRGRPTIVNTNLPQRELRLRYEDRITSRLFGEFQPLQFVGTDIRYQKA